MTDKQKQKIVELKKKLKAAKEQLILRKKQAKQDVATTGVSSVVHRQGIRRARTQIKKISDALNEAQGRTTRGRSQSNREQNRNMLIQADKRDRQRKTSQAAENEKIIQARRAMTALRKKHPNMGETEIRKIFKRRYPNFNLKYLNPPARFRPPTGVGRSGIRRRAPTLADKLPPNIFPSPRKPRLLPQELIPSKPILESIDDHDQYITAAPETAKETLWEYLTNPDMSPRKKTTVSAWKGGPDISIDSSDAAYDYDTITEKKGGSIKKGMKKAKAKAKAKAKPKIKAKVKSKSKKRASLRGWGAAKRGY